MISKDYVLYKIAFYMFFWLGKDSCYYYTFGKMIAYFLAHGCAAPKIFSSFMYDLLAYGGDACTPSI